MLTPESYSRIRATPRGRALTDELRTPYRRFKPRPDNKEAFDEQSAAVNSSSRVTVILGGTGSGKTVGAAYRVAKRLRETPPPRPRCPYWIIGETYEQVCGVCWVEKLSQFIPESMFYSEPVWLNRNLHWPKAVLLKHPTIPEVPGWIIEFRSFEQGRAKLQAASIGGAWFNEQPPLDLVEEVDGRTRDYNSPIDIDFTPLKADAAWPKRYRKPPPDWKFYHLNTELNTALAEGWAENYLASIPSDYRETRRIGLFAALQGAVFKEFAYDTHVVEPFTIPDDAFRVRGIDFGYVAPFVCVWWARLPRTVPLSDGRLAREGTWVCYREYYRSGAMFDVHAKAISQEPWEPRGVDPRHYGATAADHDAEGRAYLLKAGIATSAADKTEGSIERGLYAMKKLMLGGDSLYAPGLLIFNSCDTLIDEITGYRYPEGTDTKDPKELPLKKDDHGIDASRYCLVKGLEDRGEFPREALKVASPAWANPLSGGIPARRRA